MEDRTIHDLIAESTRDAVAVALRFQASAWRSQAELLIAQARALEGHADDIEEQRVELPVRPVRLVVEEEREPEPEPEGAPTLDAIEPGSFGNSPVFTRPDGDGFGPEMADWLEHFDDRIRMSPFFVQAVNEGAEADMPINERTAELVAGRVRELRDEAQSRGEEQT